MTLCMHVATKDALIVCSDGKVSISNIKSNGSIEFVKFINDKIKSYVYNDIVISIAGSSFYFKDTKTLYDFNDFFDNLYEVAPDMFNIRQFPNYLAYVLFCSDRYDFSDNGCDFLISGLSPKNEFYTYLVRGNTGEILNAPRFNHFACIGITNIADCILSNLIIPELSTKSVLEILKFIAKTYCNYGELVFDEMFDSKYSEDYMHINGVGGKWIFYVLDFKTKKGKYVKFCADGKIRYYSKLVQNEFS